MKMILFALLFLSACQSAPAPKSQNNFSAYEESFLKGLWVIHPGEAIHVGFHEYDEELPIPNQATLDQEKSFFLDQQKQLGTFSESSLSASEKMDRELLKNFIERSLWELNVLHDEEWNPTQYDLGDAIADVLEGHTKSEFDKLRAVNQKLFRVPDYYSAALKAIKIPTQEDTELAIKQNSGLLHYLDEDVTNRFQKSELPAEEKKQASVRIAIAHASVQTFIDGLKTLEANLKKKNGFRSFRLGADLYRTLFAYELQIGLTPEALFARATQAKKDTLDDMVKRSQALWPKYFPKQKMPQNSMKMVKKVLAKLSENHIRPEEFISTIRDLLPKLSAFIEKKDLLTLDPKKPLKVRETPIYQQGFAGAGVDAPGLGDPDRETFYNVTPLDNLPAETQQSYLREYNNYTLQILNIHEAIPGHYVQLVYNLKNPSPVKKIFGNNSMIEGWAVYVERMMLEEGYGDDSPELNLMYDKWRLREITNTILDYSLHTQNMSKKAAMKLLTEDAFQEKSEADEKWNRATYSAGQLATYFAGSTAIYEFREEMKKALGPQFQLKKFHEDFLSYGSGPIPAIVHQMKCKNSAAFPHEACS